MRWIKAGRLYVSFDRRAFAESVTDSWGIQRIAHEYWRFDSVVESGPGRLREVALYYIVAGHARFTGPRVDMNVNPSSLILLKPGTAFTFDGISHPHLELFAIRFYGASLEELVGRVAPEGMRVISTAEPDRVSWMFDSLLTQLMQADASFHSNADAWVRVILLNLLRESRTRPDVQTMAEIQFVRCKALLERDFKSIEGVGDAAGRCHLNRDYLNRLFKRFAGTTAEEYLRRTRLNAGCRLLLATDRTLADISDEVGYSDAFSFSKAFKRHFGISPTLWRRADRRSG